VTVKQFYDELNSIGHQLEKARPTAINLHWAVSRILAKLTTLVSEKGVTTILNLLETEAKKMENEDVTVNCRIADNGGALFAGQSNLSILTHCNAGALATVGIGTALGVIRSLHRQKQLSMVYADETRPLLQGGRLTTWELMADGIPVTLITDSMAGWVMKTKGIGAIIVGADRIALNGDVANKIGTYSLSVLAKEHDIPFYVAAPVSTFDFTIATGLEIPIEERPSIEITHIAGICIAPVDVPVYNPAFDVTPAKNITAIITECGNIMAPSRDKIIRFRQ
jgi:methylthioribose-1-phosphate isomerase